MAIKLEVNGSILNIVSAYAPQVNNSMEEKNNFWEDLDGLIKSVSKEERIVLGVDLNGHVGEENIGDEEIMGRYGAGTRNKEGSMVVDFGKRMDLAIVNTYFKKKDEHRVTYKSGEKSNQIDYVMCRRRNLKEMCECKVILNECVAKQHLGVDLNGHVGEENIGDEEIMGRYGAGTRNKEGSMVVDFGKRMDLAIVNTYFKKKDEHRVTYKSGEKSNQIDYVMCRRRNLKEMCDCKVILNECVAKQHRIVVGKMVLMAKKKKAEKVKPKIQWWKLKETSYQEAFRQEVTRILGGKDGLPYDWDKTAEMPRKTAKTVLGVTFGKRKGDRETWC